MKPPIITFTPGSSAVVSHNSLEPVTHANMAGLKGNPYEGMLIVDSELCLYRVRRATIKSGDGLFGGYNLFFNRRVIMNLDIEDDCKSITVEELKKMITDRLSEEDIEEFYEDHDEPFRQRLNQAHTFHDVVELIPKVD